MATKTYPAEDYLKSISEEYKTEVIENFESGEQVYTIDYHTYTEEEFKAARIYKSVDDDSVLIQINGRVHTQEEVDKKEVSYSFCFHSWNILVKAKTVSVGCKNFRTLSDTNVKRIISEEWGYPVGAPQENALHTCNCEHCHRQGKFPDTAYQMFVDYLILKDRIVRKMEELR